MNYLVTERRVYQDYTTRNIDVFVVQAESEEDALVKVCEQPTGPISYEEYLEVSSSDEWQEYYYDVQLIESPLTRINIVDNN
jgi:hypothetical protein